MLLTVEVYHDGDSWCARGVGEDVFTQGGTADALLFNIREAVALHVEDRLQPGETIAVSVIPGPIAE